MSNVAAKIKKKGKEFEILVDLDKAISFKRQKLEGNPASLRDILAINEVFTDYKKGIKPTSNDLKTAFGTDDIFKIAGIIINEGEIQLTQEFREKAREQKIKQIVEFLSRNCIDPRTQAPYTAQRIEQAIKQSGARIDDRSVDEQVTNIIKDLEKIIPLKIAVKKIEITVMPEHTGKLYNLIKTFKKDKEDWLNDGSLRCIIQLPAGMQLEFYDKLNSITQGSAITKEIKED
jgi:ribosome maturation protein SDO1